MRILQIVNSLTHTSIPIEMACEMMKTEDVEIAALYNSQTEADEFANKMGVQCKIYGFGYKYNKLKGISEYIRFLRGCSYNIIHTHHSLSGTIARIFCYKKKNIKLVHTVHANYHSYSKIQNLLIGSTLNRTDAIVFNSKSSQEGLYNWEKEKLRKIKQTIIYNGVNITRIQSNNTNLWKQICHQNMINDDDIVFAQIGRLEKVKNPWGSLKGFEELCEKETIASKKVFFIYIGDGSERNDMEQYVHQSKVLKERVIFTGTLPRDTVYDFFTRIDMLIIPSFYEGFCNTLIEGLVAGVPTIISDIDVFKEIIPKEYKISRFNPNDYKNIAACMVNNVITTKKNNRKHEREYWIDRFVLQNTVNSYLELFNSLIYID